MFELLEILTMDGKHCNSSRTAPAEGVSIGGARDYARSSIRVAGDGASLLGSNLQQLRVRIGCMVFVYHEFKAHFNPNIQQTLANQFLHYIVIILGLFA